MTLEAAPGFVKHPDHPMELVPLSGEYVVLYGGVEIARSDAVISLRESKYPERLYLPLSSINSDYLDTADKESYCPFKGTANYWDLCIDGKILEGALWGYKAPYLECGVIKDYGCFYTELGPFQIDKITS